MERKMALAMRKVRAQKESATANLQLDASADQAARKAANAKRGGKPSNASKPTSTGKVTATNGKSPSKSTSQQPPASKKSVDTTTKKPAEKSKKNTDKMARNNKLPSQLQSFNNSKNTNNQKPNNQKPDSKKSNTIDAKNDPLLAEIIALGGNQDDLSLLDDGEISADEGYEPDGQEDAKLSGEIGNMLKELGLNNKRNVAKWSTITDDNSDNEEEAEEEEDDDDKDEETIGNKMAVENEIIKATAKNDQNRQPLLIEANSLWYQTTLAPLSETALPTLPERQIALLFEKAERLVEADAELYESRPSLGGKDRTFLRTLLRSGTLSDKVSALTLLVQESPFHAVKTFTALMAMCRKKSRKEAVMTIASMKDFFTSSGLPDRKLIYFRDQPINHPKVTSKHLALWWFEDYLKKYYYEFLQVIEGLSHDPLMHVKLNMLGYMLDLLAAKSEQEQNILRLLVNKLVILVHSPDTMAQYYAIVTLNQVILTRNDTEAANQLVDLYFVYFRKLLKRQQDEQLKRTGTPTKKSSNGKKNKKQLERERKAEETAQARMTVETKMIAQVLTGVNRAFPFAKVADDVYENHLDTLFKIAHTGTFNVVVQALKLIFQTSSAKQAVSDRFYRVLYESLLDSRLAASSKQAMYLNLLYRALKGDLVLNRTLWLWCTFLISELIAEKPALKTMMTQPEDDDQEEHFTDVIDNDHDDGNNSDHSDTSDTNPNITKNDHTKPNNIANTNKYDGRKRDPQYTGAEYSCLWELVLLAKHFHPSLMHHVECLLTGERITEMPQLHLHTLSHFLDRFVYRNPKKPTTSNGSIALRGTSIMQPAERDPLSSTGLFVWQRQSGMMADELTVNSEQFLKQTDVKANELFFHKFFTIRQQEADGRQSRRAAKNKKRKRGDDDDDDDDDEIEAAILGSHKLDGDDDEDDGSDGYLDEDEDEELNEDDVWSAMQRDMPSELRRGLEDEGDEDEDDEDEDAAFAQLMNDEDDDEDVEGEEEVEDVEDVDEEPIDGSDAELATLWSDEDSDAMLSQDETKDEREKKRPRKQPLPTFASFDDYAHLIEQDNDDDMDE
ncbi:CBF/Mak21 family-domain-containing protein [Syncephalis fuscata]|nr:CBF/Mak21 family-domain-containing protein [Syncephalis fuscata]